MHKRRIISTKGKMKMQNINKYYIYESSNNLVKKWIKFDKLSKNFKEK